ncbi:biotin-dependent carboxyltransferase family protein [Dyella sp.]|uniref:5-oxoprolinase subunit C family protein n=1 Tax=Dyella sp. TaxID=1869338 RepID=UPI002D774AA3|nr:biotin-dependent carboxyltransferase family protein [Dyella sp.]HET6432593.1 biotin-dependent carboxyltransferase family protein [Dyella sp.]
MSLRVLQAGLLTTVQDGGRPGHAALGLGRAGAMDRPAWRLGNALVGNVGDEAALEIALRGPVLRIERATRLALTGAPIDARLDNVALPPWTAVDAPAGSTLRLGGMRQGCRSYLALRGGIATEPVLGSRSEDVHARIGPLGGRALRAGDVLPLGAAFDAASISRVSVRRWGVDPRSWFDFAMMPIALLPGSHVDALDDDARHQLHGARFRVSASSNRTGSRLDGPALHLRAPLELISAAVLPGTVQLPPSGQPIVLMAEAPVTGGYPRIGQIAAADLPRIAQRRPGDAVCFEAVSLAQALDRQHDREQQLQRLVQRVIARGESC